MILIFIVGGMFSLLLVGLMLVYIRRHQCGIDTSDRDESLNDQIELGKNSLGETIYLDTGCF